MGAIWIFSGTIFKINYNLNSNLLTNLSIAGLMGEYFIKFVSSFPYIIERNLFISHCNILIDMFIFTLTRMANVNNNTVNKAVNCHQMGKRGDQEGILF